MKRLLVSALSIFLVGAPVVADDEADAADVYEMGEVIITGSKLPQTPGNVTQKISIITADELGSLVLGNGNLAEILSYTPGNFANVLSRNDANWGSSGGLAHTYKGYMLDGLPIDAFVDLQSLDSWAFQRVEDQRGSASVLYPTYLAMDFAGNQSPLAGTANFILKERVASTRTSASAYYGSYNTIGGRFFHQRAAGNLHMFVGSHYEGSDYTDYGTEGSWLNMIDNPEYKKAKLYMRGTYFLNDSGQRASLYAHRTWHNGDAGRPTRGFGHAYTTLNAGYTNPISDRVTASAKIGYRDYVRRWEEDKFERNDDGDIIPESLVLLREDGVDQSVMPADLSLSIITGESNVLTAGVDYQHASYETSSESAESGETTIGNDATATTIGFYAQEELRLDALILRAGARYNIISHDIDLLQGSPPGDDSNSWNKVLYSAGGRYNHSDELAVYANIGTSFKAPSLKSVGGTIPLESKGDSTLSGHVPNPDIKPESGTSFDVGVNFRPQDGLQVGLRGFNILLADQIVQRAVPAAPQSEDINAGNTTTRGAEVEVTHRLDERVEWFANYTFTNAEVTENTEDPSKVGAKINFVPESSIGVGVHLTFPQGLRATVTVQSYSGIFQDVSTEAEALPGYTLVNARIQYGVRTQDGYDLSLYLEPYNITNQTFEMPWQFQDPGFSVNGGLMVSF
ncbi:MAG: TonB-dependent receptor [Gemmatimonadetes bacterium]|nr:TonB-dependent receptor [Gemmatimonadota bacterium]MYI60427.1 TonB-dependent receptor [Gemmatimonadota bacterium]